MAPPLTNPNPNPLTLLATTPFPCTSLHALSGGSVNYIYRGTLASDPSQTIIVKHSTDTLSCNPTIPISVSRWDFEVAMMRGLMAFDGPLVEGAAAHGSRLSVRPVKLLHASTTGNARVQVHEDIGPDAQSLEAALWSTSLDVAAAKAIGRDLGTWLRCFHDWISAPEQADLAGHVAKNADMAWDKFRFEYGCVARVLGDFPEIRDKYGAALRKIVGALKREMEDLLAGTGPEGEEYGIVHGDFWPGNVLVSSILGNSSVAEDGTTQQTEPVSSLHIIDWEYAHYTHRAHDLGHFIASLVEIAHFTTSAVAQANAISMISTFIAGYGLRLDETSRAPKDDLAARIPVHAGAHMIGWYTRRNPSAPLSEPLERVTAFMELGAEFMVKGWSGDVTWLKDLDEISDRGSTKERR